MTAAQVQTVELGIIVIQLATISPALLQVRAACAKLLAHFRLDKEPSSPASESK